MYSVVRALHESGWSVLNWADVETTTFYDKIYNSSETIGTYYGNVTAYCVSNYFNWLLYGDLKKAEFGDFVEFLQSFS
jgi:hypothetical protein